MRLLDISEAKKIVYKDKNKSYTYGLCKSNGDLFYVGVGIRNRVFQHISTFELKNSNNKLKINTTSKALREGGIKFVIFMVHADRQECLKLEANLIKYFGRQDNLTGILTNLTDGGEIGPVGVIISDNVREKLSRRSRLLAPHLSQKNKDFWASLSEGEKQIRINRMQSNRADGELLSKLLVDRWADPEYKKRLTEKAKESQKLCADVHKANMKAKWADPEFREWMLLRRKMAREKRVLEKLKET